MQQPSADSISEMPASNASDARAAQTLTLTLPAPLARELDSATQDFLVDLLARGLREFRVERALEHYAHGGMSFGAAAQQAGVSPADLARASPIARGMEPPTSEETLAEELGQRPGQCRLLDQPADGAAHAQRSPFLTAPPARSRQTHPARPSARPPCAPRPAAGKAAG